MVNIATFDIIPKDDWYPVWFSLPIDEPRNDRFADLGLGSHFFVMNFGTLFLALLFLKIQTILYIIVKKCCKKEGYTESAIFWRKIEKKLGDDLYLNSYIRFIYTSYIEIVFAVGLNCY